MTPDEIQKLMPGLSRKNAEGLASLEAECKRMGGSLEDLMRYVREAQAKGISGGSMLVYAGARLHEPTKDVSKKDVEALRSLSEFEAGVGAKAAMDAMKTGVDALVAGKKLGLNAKQTKEAIERGAEMARMAREHGLDPGVWLEIADEIKKEGLTGDEAGEALMDRFLDRADRASWPKKDES